jgi:hypothetical protein
MHEQRGLDMRRRGTAGDTGTLRTLSEPAAVRNIFDFVHKDQSLSYPYVLTICRQSTRKPLQVLDGELP